MRRTALFAHYDGENQVKRYILYFLAELSKVCDEVVFISTARLAETEMAKVRSYAKQVLLKENVGFDFGMWREGIDAIDLSSVDELVLANSSVFGPVFPLSRSFDRMARSACDFWGMTDNLELDWHLQTYFVVFRRGVVSSGHLQRFFATVLPYRDKRQVIRSYETGLTVFLQEQGFCALAMIPRSELPTNRPWTSIRSNSTVYCPRQLLERGMPFVKVETLRENPAGVVLRPVYELMRTAGYDLGLVEFDRPSQDREPALGKLLYSVHKRAGGRARPA